MNKLFIYTTSLFLLAAPARGAVITDPSQLSPGSTLIDFESVVTNGNLITPLSNPVTVGDVTFTSITGTLSVFDITVSGSWGADGTEIASKTLFPGGEPDSAILIEFTNPVSQILLGWGDPNFPGNFLKAYDANGNLLEQAFVELGPPGGVHAAWIGFKRPRPDIASVLVQPNQSLPSGDDYVIDNIRYSTNSSPSCSSAKAFPALLWSPNHQFVPVEVIGVTDPEGDAVTITVTSVTQDEPVKDNSFDPNPDAVIEAGSTLVRAERLGAGNGRVYEVSFRARDENGGFCTGAVTVSIPHSLKKGLTAINDGQLYDSTVP
ncbi:MAG: hypothetical protein JSR29_01500 [Nitrospira sp.]|nr:hypothetical protein [Nitrospira sp.]